MTFFVPVLYDALLMALQKILHTATEAARKAGEVLLSFQGSLTHVRKKGAIDLVTDADIASEKVVLDTIRAAFPAHSVLTEETGTHRGDARHQWIVDPLDGTTNFAHHLDLFAVSIGFAVDGDLQVGVVFNPVSGELFHAVRGMGAMQNGRPIHVSTQDRLQDSLLVTGFPYRLQEMMTPLINRFTRCLGASQGVRRLGSAALDLCFVACGRFEGFWEQWLNPWDTAAGSLILTEAGGHVTDFENRLFQIEMKEILATNGRIHDAMLPLLCEVQQGTP